MAGKMSPKFITLCSLAVGAIYSTGYSITTSHNTAAAAPAVQSQASAPSAGSTKQTSGNGSNAGSSSANTSSHKDTSGKSSKSHSHDKHAASSSSAGNKSASSSQKTSSSASTSKSSQKKTNTSQQYLDGTYNGSASNRIGAVAVAVKIKQGKIANVQITQCDTHYPERYINPVLPNYVVAHQTTQIPVVSGATLSTRDFYFAVVQALSQAKNPNYKG